MNKNHKTSKSTSTRKLSLRSIAAKSSVVIRKLVRENPRREGSIGFNSFSLIRSGMTVDRYLARGGRNKDLRWDLAHGYVQLEPVSH